MNIELKKIDKDKLKVGDVVGVAREIQCGWRWFRHSKIIPAKIIKITPKRTKIVSDKFGEHDKREVFYVLDRNAAQETILAETYETFRTGIYELGELVTSIRAHTVWKRSEEIYQLCYMRICGRISITNCCVNTG